MTPAVSPTPAPTAAAAATATPVATLTQSNPEGTLAGTATARPTGLPGPAASMLADSGLRPAVDGFTFANYGALPGGIDLTVDEMRRMFGDAVCGSSANGTCTLSPPAQMWLNKANSYMAGGHCEGMAALSLLLYTQNESPSRFGPGATHAADLQLESNPLLQREIAYWYATQLTSPTADNEIIDKTPAELLDMLLTALKPGQAAPATFTMGVYRPGYLGGHSLIPYAVQDLGNGKFAVLVYDNNYPGLSRSVAIDRAANTWRYFASTDPSVPASEYRGDAKTKTLTLTRTAPRLLQQVCEFCGKARQQSRTAGGPAGFDRFLAWGAPALRSEQALWAPPAAASNEVWLQGAGSLLLTDESGRRTGYRGGAVLNEIPGARLRPVRTGDLWQNNLPPVYALPAGTQFSVTLDGSALQTAADSSVTMIGAGYDLAVEHLRLHPGQQDSLRFSPDGLTASYTSQEGESPTLALGMDTPAADYAFLLKGVDLTAGASVTFTLDEQQGRLAVSTTNETAPAAYDLVVERIDDHGLQVFDHQGVTLPPNETEDIEYAAWPGNGSDLAVGVDTNNDGTIDQTMDLTDQGDDTGGGPP